MTSTHGFAKATDPVCFEKMPSVTFFRRQLSKKELFSADVLAIDYEYIDCISDFAKQIIDSGITLFIASPKKSIEDISQILSIPSSVKQTYQALPLMAYCFFKANEHYFSIQIYAERVEEVSEANAEMPSASVIKPDHSKQDWTLASSEFSKVTFLSTVIKMELLIPTLILSFQFLVP